MVPTLALLFPFLFYLLTLENFVFRCLEIEYMFLCCIIIVVLKFRIQIH
jgi:hypothetical protein